MRGDLFTFYEHEDSMARTTIESNPDMRLLTIKHNLIYTDISCVYHVDLANIHFCPIYRTYRKSSITLTALELRSANTQTVSLFPRPPSCGTLVLRDMRRT